MTYWFMICLVCAVAAFAQCMRDRQFWLAGAMAVSAVFSVIGIVTP